MNVPGFLKSYFVDPDVDLGDPEGYALYAEILHPEDLENIPGFVLDLVEVEWLFHEGRPWLPSWASLQEIVCRAMDVEPSQLVWWCRPYYPHEAIPA